MKHVHFTALFVLTIQVLNAQNIQSEKVEVQLLQMPRVLTEANDRTFSVKVNSPYSLTAEDIIAQSKVDHQKALDNYDNKVLESEREYQQKLKDYDLEVVKANQKFEKENEAFKNLSLLERLAIADKGGQPKLVTPAKPQYYKPYPPVYQQPNLDNYIIVDNNVLASQINVDGFKRGNPILDITIDIEATKFQDNAGQTFANQPTKLVVKYHNTEEVNTTFFTDFEFVASVPSNNINKPLEEKNYLKKVMAFLNGYLNDMYGYTEIKKQVEVEFVKNKGDYDDLEKAHIYVTTNLKKWQASSNPEDNKVASTNMQKGIDIWQQVLSKVEYKNSKAVYNAKIARYLYFNLIRLNMLFGNKAEAEKYLNQLQENLVYIKLSGSEEKELDVLEKAIYKK